MEELKSVNRRVFIKGLGALGATAALSNIPLDALADSEVKITILHTNDVHSRIEPFPMDGSRNQGLGGVARRSTLIQKIRKEEKMSFCLMPEICFRAHPISISLAVSWNWI